MQQIIIPVLKSKLLNLLFWMLLFNTCISAQETIGRTPEEQRELFGYCEKPMLIKQLKVSSETADQIGQIHYWATLQKIKIAENINDTFATIKEVEEEVTKKYKAIHLSADQIKDLVAKRKIATEEAPCAVITLTANHDYDTMAPPRLLQLYKLAYRKQLIEKTGINGRQADMLFEIEVWKQKEALTIDKIPNTEFNRIRSTVSMYAERERRFRVVGISEDQLDNTLAFLNQNAPTLKK
jgi:hypothetical protein